MDAGISSYTFTWAVGVPGQEPLRCMSAFDLIQKAADFQVPVVQLADNLPLHSFSDEQIEDIGRFATERNIRIEPGAREMTDEMLNRYLGIAVQLNAPLVRFVIDSPRFQPSLNDVHQIIRNALPALKQKGIVLAIENHDRFKAREFAAMVEKAASSQVGICLDTVNSMGAGEGLETVIGLLAPLTVNLHVKEFCVERAFHKMGLVIEGKPLGKGMLPVGELLAKVNPRCQSAILEQWTPPEAAIEATIRKEADWALDSIHYLKSSLQPMKRLSFLILILICLALSGMAQEATQWSKHEISFTSNREYGNPVYDLKEFKISFVSPSGRTKVVRGFWDGGKDWKVRFLPDEAGTWKWTSECSDQGNSGLHAQTGSFICRPAQSREPIYQRGAVGHRPGQYYLCHADGTPFFWLACTAWNGALKSTGEEWQYYLNQRKANQYNVIQLVTTEWRGCDKNAEGLTAIEGGGYIRIHPEFFKRIDQRIDEANALGFVISPVILWALPGGPGRHLSPGYSLPLEEAVLLAKYIVARYQGNQVVWALGGDGRYTGDQELKWKEIGRRVFNDTDHAPVTLHPQGSSWIGELYAAEDWYDLMAYQSSHDNGERVVNWINKGPMSQMWSKLKPMPYINMEPNYEEIHFRISDKDVRNASYWSLFATPVAGITYGANGVWPWLAEGEPILNHSHKAGVTGWRKSIEFPGSIQMGYLAGFFKQLEWWNLFPSNEVLAAQPGEKAFDQWVSVLKTPDHSTIIAYIPQKADIELFNPGKYEYAAQWFDPVSNSYQKAAVQSSQGRIRITQNFDHDMLILLKRKR